MRELATSRRRTGTVIATTTAKRAARPAVIWGALFGLLVANEALTYHSTFPTAASRKEFAEGFGSNTALSAVIGPGRHLDTIGGVVAWRVFGLMIIVGAIWGLLTATRLLRGEEDGGRWELLLAGRTSRRRATVQALLGLGIGWLGLWAVTAAVTVAAGSRPSVGLSVSASLFYATAGTVSAAMFLAVGALASQLAATRRQANGLAAATFAVAYLLRLIADAGIGLAWMRWTTPLGWVENMRPLTGSQPLALVPVVLVTAALATSTVVVAGRRDVGAGALTRRRPATASTRWLNSPAGLALRLERWVIVSWVAGLGGLALVFGVVAAAAGDGNFASTVGQTVGRLGGHGSGAEAWIGYEFLYLAAILAFAAAAQIAALRSEEGDGYLDNLLARPVSRRRWLAGRLGVGMALVAGSGLAVAVGGWIGVAGQGIGFLPLLRAGMNVAVPGLFVLGLGTLLYGLVPRLAAPTLYLLVLWSFLVETIGTSITSNHWVLDTAVLTHLGPVPAASLHWTAITTLLGIAIVCAIAGVAAFNRRDLAAT
jgi:ABC-2 type transport system permease protein